MYLAVKNNITKSAIGLFLALSILPLSAHANSSADNKAKGRQIALEADKRESGFGNSEELLKMTLRDSRGNERVREMRIRVLERADGGDWSMTVFDNPRDVKGTALLTYSNGLEPDDQWFYLPALKRVKRISSKNRSGSFMGSEFAFEDMSAFEEVKYDYEFIREEPCGEQTCFVTTWTPLYENSGYSKAIVWQDTTEYRTHKIEYYNQQGEFYKTLIAKDYKLYKERFWRPMTLVMTNHKTEKETLLNYKDYQFDLGFTESDFSQSALKRFR